MTIDEAIIILGNIPINGDECYSIAEYQEAKTMAIEALKAIDDIRAEFISQYPKNVYGDLELGGRSCVFSLNKALEIIDKHIKEGE